MIDVSPAAGAADPRAVKVGVLLDQQPAKLGEWLADAAAFDAGGADALWVDLRTDQTEPELDALALAAALAAVTFRARLVVALSEADIVVAGIARTLDTVGRLSYGRLDLIAGPSQGQDDRDGRGGQGRVAEFAAGIPDVGVFRREPGGFETANGDGAAQRWASVPAPHGRVSWLAEREHAAGNRVHGLVVPAVPRLLDLLRNPDDPGHRR